MITIIQIIEFLLQMLTILVIATHHTQLVKYYFYQPRVSLLSLPFDFVCHCVIVEIPGIICLELQTEARERLLYRILGGGVNHFISDLAVFWAPVNSKGTKKIDYYTPM